MSQVPPVDTFRSSMTKDINLDFGNAIAYLVPGMLAAFALTKLFPELQKLFKKVYDGEAIAGALALLIIVSIALGMIISVLRGTVIDKTFDYDLPESLRSRHLHEWANKIENKEVSFSWLTNEGIMAAFRETRNHRRLYQFYGNTLLAMFFILASRVSWPLTGDFWLAFFGFIFVAPFLYTACRHSFYLLSKANREIKEAATREINEPT